MDYRNVTDGFKLLPDGWYNVEVKEVEDCEEVWKITFQVIDQTEYFGSRIFDRIMFMDKLASRNKMLFDLFGYPVDDQELDVEANDLLNKKLKVDVYTEVYKNKEGKDKTINKIQFFDGYKPCDLEDGADVPL